MRVRELRIVENEEIKAALTYCIPKWGRIASIRKIEAKPSLNDVEGSRNAALLLSELESECNAQKRRTIAAKVPHGNEELNEFFSKRQFNRLDTVEGRSGRMTLYVKFLNG